MTLEPFTGAVDQFAAFVQPHLPTLTWLAACLAPGEEDDLVQRSLTRAWHRRSRFDPGTDTERGWLCAVLSDQSRRGGPRPGPDRLRELVVQRPDGGDLLPVRGIDADPVDLGHALELLTDLQRRAVQCHHLVGLTVADTAMVMGCRVDTVGSALTDARRRLRRELLPSVAQETEGPGTDEPDRSREVDRWLDTLLRTGGAQFRAALLPAVFEQPSPRIAILGRRARLGLISGIAVAIVGVLVAGSTIARNAGAQLSSPPGAAAAASFAQLTPRTARARPTSTPAGTTATVDVGPAAEVIGTRPGWPSAGLITAAASAAGAAGGVRMAWDVATGELLAGIPERLLCNDRQIRLRLDNTGALHLDLYGGIGPDQGCTRTSLRVVAFAPLPGQNEGESVVRVTGTTGSLLLPGLSGLELDPVRTGAGLPSVSSVRTVGTSPDVDVQWQPATGRLLVSARGCGAFATADLGNGTEVTVVIRPTERPCPGAARTLTHVIQIPPHPPGAPFQVVVLNSTADRSPTTDVFSVPATLLRPLRKSATAGRATEQVAPLSALSRRQRELVGVDRVGRTADNTLYFESDSGPGGVELRVPTAQLVSDQMIVLSRSTERSGTRASGLGTIGASLGIPSVSDVHRPLLVRIGAEELVLPAL